MFEKYNKKNTQETESYRIEKASYSNKATLLIILYLKQRK